MQLSNNRTLFLPNRREQSAVICTRTPVFAHLVRTEATRVPARSARLVSTAAGLLRPAPVVPLGSTSLMLRRVRSLRRVQFALEERTAVLVLLRALVSDQRAANSRRACDVPTD